MDSIQDEILDDAGRGDSRNNKASCTPERSVPGRMADATGSPLSRVDSQDSILTRLGVFDETVDPSNPDFDFERWARTIMDMRARLGLPVPVRSGVVFKKLVVHGSGLAVKEQDTIWRMLAACFSLRRHFRKKQAKTILHGIDGIVQKGELLLVLGRPGSGCSTFLKTITGKMDALELDSNSVINYRGVPHEIMTKRFQGELVYNEEVDKHFPYLTVGETLEFAAAMRTPRVRLPGVTRADRRKHVVSVVLAIFGLSHTRNTIVGDDYIRGVSGGERKRVSIAETALSEAALTAWDNSTRGLDAESALNFVARLRTLSDLTQSSNATAIYQASQAVVDLCDKVMVLYEGREIFFGRVHSAVPYFEEMGWHRPARQTAGDFLTAVTNPAQREARTGFENAVPKTAEDFEDYWHKSPQYASLKLEIDQHLQEVSSAGGAGLREFELSRGALKSKRMLSRAPQTVWFPMQTGLCARRAYQQLRNDKTSTAMAIIGEIVLALVVGSMFYGTPTNTSAFFSYGSLLFFSVLLNVLMAMTDIHTMYKGRPVIRKQVSYAFYRPSADALATVLVDLPVKLVLAIFFNVILYFLAGLGVTAAQFFTFFLVVFLATLAMSFLFRTIAASTNNLPQAMAICGFLVLVLVAYTGFVLPGPYMPPWFKWISYINPLSYAFEALLVNQAHGTNYPCTSTVPNYQNMSGDTFICAFPGANPGQPYVSGDEWFETGYGYSYSHLWRNVGILAGFLVFFLVTYLLAVEFNTSAASDPDVLVFLHDGPGTHPKAERNDDIESGLVAATSTPMAISTPLAISKPLATTGNKSISAPRIQDAFSWENVNLEVKIGGQSRQLLNDVSGWVRPGTLTALMGVSGAGKTTLLNALAHRPPSATARGRFYTAGEPIPASFTSEIGYVQQQDVHLETSTVREALQFSAMLRQPKNVPKKEKLAFAEKVIGLLEMEEFAGAVIGIPGKGLNVEQRKRVSIGVELAAKPRLLLFLDEPTSGLDGQSSMAIVSLLRRLAAGGLGILCTIHQPSAIMFEEFDRVLLMASGGRTVYFGDVGTGSETVLRYFSHHGAKEFLNTENPADYLLNVIQTAEHGAGSEARDWPRLWSESAEAKEVSATLAQMKVTGQQPRERCNGDIRPTSGSARKSTLLLQLPVVCCRVIQFYWRSPTYILSKYMLAILASLLIGFSFFQSGGSILGVQNAIFGVLMVCATFSALVQQTIPRFILQRSLYEVRERHSNTYAWAVLASANILVEIVYNILLGVISFAIFNYTVFGIRDPEDQGLVLLFFICFYVFTGTFAHMVAAPVPNALVGGRVTTILFSMTILFAGVFQPPQALPGFWIFMYRVSPMTYILSGISVTGLSGNTIVCSQDELAVFNPPDGMTCGSYLAPYLQGGALGTLLNPDATANCSYCPLKSADQVLARSGMYYDQRWRNWAICLAYIVFNISFVFGFYFVKVQPWGKWSERVRGMWRRTRRSDDG